MKLKTKKFLLILVMLLPLYTVTFSSSIALETHLETESLRDLRAKVDVGMNMCRVYKQLVDDGLITEDQATTEIGEVLCGPKRENDIRDISQGILTGERGYMAIVSSNGTILVHPYMEGKNMNEISPVSAEEHQYYLEKRRGSHYTSWRNLGETSLEEKMNVFDYFETWGWIIVATAYKGEYRIPPFFLTPLMLANLVLITIVSLYVILSNKISTKTFHLLLLIVLFLLGALFFASLSMHSNFSEWMHASMEKELKSKVRFGINVCSSFEKMTEMGVITREKATEEIGVFLCGPKREDGTRDISQGILTGEEGYMCINEEDGRQLIHPYHEGLNEREINPEIFEWRTGKRNRTILYLWRNPGEPAPRQKMEAFERFDPWGWVVVATAYVDEYIQSVYVLRNYLSLNMITVAFTSLFSIILANELRKIENE